ncbi:hypothetical protein ACOMHN_014903 [Nucella lapillus]
MFNRPPSPQIKAQLQEGNDGRIQIANERRTPPPRSHGDLSKAYTIQERGDANDVSLKMMKAIKKDRVPSDVVFDNSKISVGPQGEYKEGEQFEYVTEDDDEPAMSPASETGENFKLRSGIVSAQGQRKEGERKKKVLGKGRFADVVVVRDKKTAEQHAMKMVMNFEFNCNEVRAMRDLGDSDRFPSLYLYRRDHNKVYIHMEIVQHGVTLEDIINVGMARLIENKKLVRLFSLSMFHDLLSAMKEMHNRNWVHWDLHGGNVMFTKDSVKLKILDFGLACPLRKDGNFNHKGLKNDFLDAIRLFWELYIGEVFEGNFTLENVITRSNGIDEVLSKTAAPLSPEDCKEIKQLTMTTYQVTSNPLQVGYGDTEDIMEDIERKLLPAKKMEILQKATAAFDLDFYTSPKDDLRGGKEVVDDAAVSGPDGDGAEEFDQDLH